MQMDIYVSAANKPHCVLLWCLVCVRVCSECGVGAVMSRAGKLPARWQNNAHKRLKKEASGADVLLTALNGTVENCLGVCVRVVHVLTSETNTVSIFLNLFADRKNGSCVMI